MATVWCPSRGFNFFWAPGTLDQWGDFSCGVVITVRSWLCLNCPSDAGVLWPRRAPGSSRALP
eukprot:1850616-Pyramimonas_sp.AAC.1